jgi:hypothetical protein
VRTAALCSHGIANKGQQIATVCVSIDIPPIFDWRVVHTIAKWGYLCGVIELKRHLYEVTK